MKHKLLVRKKDNKVALFLVMFLSFSLNAINYKIVDTGQVKFFNNTIEISEPESGSFFYGQDAQINGYQSDYTDNSDGTITDNVTGLIWTKTCDTNGDGNIDYDDKLSYEEAIESITDICIGGYNDWRLPTIKEQYSLIMFSGIDPSGYEGNVEGLIPFINTDYFDFAYGDESAGERIIDAQMVTSTLYVAETMNGDETVFGVNFADGRIKGYGTGPLPGQNESKKFYVYYVRGNMQYGINVFEDNGDETISDNATGLMWAKNDSAEGLNWEEALFLVQQCNSENYLGYNDWRLPNIKELQSIVDYSRSPETTNSAAIDPLFSCSEITNANGATDYPYYWSSTTHENWTENNGGYASYISFGRALGWMEEPPMSGNYELMDVHGAGAQRSDPKDGNPDDYPYGHGPQGDVIRIFNYVRLVRDINPDTGMNEDDANSPENSWQIKLCNYPNPFNPSTTIEFKTELDIKPNLTIYNIKGQKVKQYFNLSEQDSVVWDGLDENGTKVNNGVYLYEISAEGLSETNKMMLLK